MKLGDLFQTKYVGWWCHITPPGTNSNTSIESLLKERLGFSNMRLDDEEPVVFLAEQLLEEAHAHVLFLHPEHGVCVATDIILIYLERIAEP